MVVVLVVNGAPELKRGGERRGDLVDGDNNNNNNNKEETDKIEERDSRSPSMINKRKEVRNPIG